MQEQRGKDQKKKWNESRQLEQAEQGPGTRTECWEKWNSGETPNSELHCVLKIRIVWIERLEQNYKGLG